MIKIAVVGTNGLAQLIAHFISTTTSHQFVILSRRVCIPVSSFPNANSVQPVPGLTAKGWQVLVVDYNNSSDLRFKLAGVDTVISTVSGNAQLNLIEAAASARVRRFAPSEFGGPPALRPQGDPLDNHRRAAILRLSQLESTGMKFAVFTCGIFYERFAPGGMASSQIGVNSNIGQEGDYIMNIRRSTAQLPYNASDGHSAMVCVTGARDVAQFVVAALSLSSWPREFRMRGERMSVRELVSVAEHVLGKFFSFRPTMLVPNKQLGRSLEVSRHTRRSLSDALTYARAVRDGGKEIQLHHLVATAEGRFDFTDANLNHAVHHRPEKFHDYLTRVWASA